MKDQHMRASSPFYSKPLGIPCSEEKVDPALRLETIQRLSLAFNEVLRSEYKKGTFSVAESLEALVATLVTTAATQRDPSISKGDFVGFLTARVAEASSNVFDIASKNEARTGVAG